MREARQDRSGSGRWRRLLGVVLALSVVAAACSDSDDPDLTADPVGADQPGTTGSGDGGAGGGGTLVYGYSLNPSRFDAHRSTIGQDIRLLAPVYDRLIHYDESGTLIPGLATKWEFSDDGLELRFELRQGVVFHDGAPFDAQAVAANIERGKTVEGSSIVSDLADIEEVEVVDDHEVIFHLSAPNAILPGLMSSRAGMMVSPTAFDNPDLDMAPVGAGPYRVTDYQMDHQITYERFEEHWDGELVGPDKVEVRVLADGTTRMNALLTGEVDVAILAGNQVEEARRAGFSIDQRPTTAYLVLYLNRARSHFDKLEVRQALNHAIDRQALIAAVLEGAGDATVQPFATEYYAHNPDYPADHYRYDPARAKELLAQAGLPDGFTFEMLVPATETGVLMAEVTAQMLSAVGIQSEFRQIDAAQTADIYYAQQEGDSLIAQWGGRPDPQITMNLQFSDTGFSNPGRHTTERFLELNTAAKAAIDADERRSIMQDMVGEIVDQAFQVPLAHDYMNHAYRDGVDGFTLLPQGELFFQRISVQD